MELNTPPPGASRAVEIVPAVLRSGSPALQRTAAVHPTARPTDALSAMLRGSTRWDSVGTPVTWTVTLVSWLLLGLDIAAVFVTRAFRDGAGVFSRILTWNYHSGAVTGVAMIATLVMVGTAVMTRGLRSANLLWLRVWIAGAIVSVLAIAAMVVAAVLGLLFIVVGIVIGAFAIFIIGAAIAAGLDG